MVRHDNVSILYFTDMIIELFPKLTEERWEIVFLWKKITVKYFGITNCSVEAACI